MKHKFQVELDDEGKYSGIKFKNIDQSQISQICKDCIKTYRRKFNRFSDDHIFNIKCSFIPKDDVSWIPEEIRYRFSDEELQEANAMFDSSIWAEKTFNWRPRYYQNALMKCTAQRKVARCGRRVGKTQSIAYDILHKAFTSKNRKILVITPYASQIHDIFDRIKEIISSNPEIENCIARNVSSPYPELVFNNGSRIRGFTAGSKSGGGATVVRGQDADDIYIDEQDFLSDKDLDAISAIARTHQHVNIWNSSTPQGWRRSFYRFCMESDQYREFHYPSSCLPHWSRRDEEAARNEVGTEEGYIHEYEAEFGDALQGVFRAEDIDRSIEAYKYEDLQPQDDWYYTIGVDWNSEAVGSQIYVIGTHKSDIRFYGVEKKVVSRKDFTQLTAVNELIKLIRKWKPVGVCVDAGYGETQVELLRNHFNNMALLNAQLHDKTMKISDLPDNRTLEELRAEQHMLEHLHTINFSSNLQVYDFVTREEIKKPAKPFLVSNAVRILEQGLFAFSENDEQLQKQLRGYAIIRRSPSGMPIYGVNTNSQNVGDHLLDAMMLALLAFKMEFSDLFVFHTMEDIKFTDTTLGSSISEFHETVNVPELGFKSVSIAKQQLPNHRTAFKDSLTAQGSIYNTQEQPKYANTKDFLADVTIDDLPQFSKSRTKYKAVSRTRNL